MLVAYLTSLESLNGKNHAGTVEFRSFHTAFTVTALSPQRENMPNTTRLATLTLFPWCCVRRNRARELHLELRSLRATRPGPTYGPSGRRD